MENVLIDKISHVFKMEQYMENVLIDKISHVFKMSNIWRMC